MDRDHFFFLVGGLAVGILIGFGSYHAVHTSPELASASPGSVASMGSPQGAPMGAPPGGPGGSPQAGSGGAPMVAQVNELKRLLQERPDDPSVLAGLANLHYDAGMWQQAAGYYERAVEIVPNADMLTDLGVCYRELGDHERALDVFSRAHEMDPAHWQSLYNTMVVNAFDLGRYDLATGALDAIEAITPPPADLDRGRLEQIREMLERMAGEANQPS